MGTPVVAAATATPVNISTRMAVLDSLLTTGNLNLAHNGVNLVALF